MRTFVISLPESVERRARIEGQLAEQNVPFSFFDAINLASDRNHYFHHCDEQRFLLHTGRTPTSGELGCFASHLMLWRTCRLLNEPLVILEDDAALAPDFGAALPFVQRYISRCGFVRLQNGRARGKRDLVRQRQRTIDFCKRYPYGSLAYAISPEVAHAFIERSEVFQAPVDVFIKRYWEHGQPLFAVSPALAGNSDLSRRSLIVGRDRGASPAALVARRWWQKRQDFLARALFNLRWLRRERRRATLQMAQQFRRMNFKSDG